jgi:YcxB-like protein
VAKVPTQVVTELARSDLIALNIYLLPRRRVNVATFWIAVLVIFLLGIKGKPFALTNALASAMTAFLVAGVGMLFGLLLSIGYSLVASTEKSGTLGKHTYTLHPEGLHELTVANESLHRWSSVLGVIKTKRFIYMPISAYLYHVVPRRSFGSDLDYHAFWEEAHVLCSRAAT